jgi:ubiquinone/menaquinone biosynthesis C-methylase UbiE
MRVLDLGCGTGTQLAAWGIGADDEVTGLDIDEQRLTIARHNFPNRTYLHGAGERMPVADQSFDWVISGVAVPYMNIPRTLREIYRALMPGGRVSLSLHVPAFTFAELVHHAIPRPVPTLYRLYVLSNGCLFHATGKTVGFLNGRTESFQTERGMKLALRRAGFAEVSFRRGRGATAETLVAEARKPLTSAQSASLLAA